MNWSHAHTHTTAEQTTHTNTVIITSGTCSDSSHLYEIGLTLSCCPCTSPLLR